MSHSEVPPASKFEEPILRVLGERAEPLANDAIDAGVARHIGLSEEALRVVHDPTKGSRTEFSYRMAWARTRLKAKGMIERVGPGTWRLARAGHR
ncbi:MAG: hypothetical protein KJ015_38135 [Myxococcales bacterium]|nr:hypothetical protein [Myxococcales bacterium]